MNNYSIGINLNRDYDYLKLARVREQEALSCLNPTRRSWLQAAARYARQRAISQQAQACTFGASLADI